MVLGFVKVYQRITSDEESLLLQVRVAHMGPKSRTFKVKGLSSDGPARLEFDDQEGNRTSVADYFLKKYNRQ